MELNKYEKEIIDEMTSMFNANTANEMTTKNIQNNCKKELERIFDLITKTVLKGEYGIFDYSIKDMSDGTKHILEYLGYEVKYYREVYMGADREEPEHYTIEW